MKKYLLSLLLIILIVPSVALASWWNPFSWFNGWTFHKSEIAPQVQTETQKTPEEKINELQKQVGDLKNQKLNSDSTTTTNSLNIPKTTKKIVSTSTKPIQPEKPIVPASIPLVQTEKQVSSITNPALESVDKYGMTDADWVREIASITTVRERISSNEKYITKNEEYITNLDSGINTVLNTLTSSGLLDSTGKQYAQSYIDLAQKLQLGYKNEIDLVKSENNLLNQIITATYNHDKDLMEKLGKTFTSNSEEFNILMKQDVSLFTQQTSAFNIFYNYFKLHIQSYNSTPTYTPTYIPPQTQQYNTDCSISSYYGGGGGTANCTTYSPSSSAISACAYIKDMMASQSYIDKAYAKCLQDHS